VIAVLAQPRCMCCDKRAAVVARSRVLRHWYCDDCFPRVYRSCLYLDSWTFSRLPAGSP
jgi:hypothetical protein